jgi:hypothetical protein
MGKSKGVVALTSSHLAFERHKLDSNQPAALFVSFPTISMVACVGTTGVRLTHGGGDVVDFELEDEAAAKDLHAALLRVVVNQESSKVVERKESGSEVALRGLCIHEYAPMGLRECDEVILVKDDPKEEMWYGERVQGGEGYFPATSVVLMPPAIPTALKLSQSQYALLAAKGRRVQVSKGQRIAQSGDLSSVGLLYFVETGVCCSETAPTLYYTREDVWGELGVLIGCPLENGIVCFSAEATILQLDCRRGSVLDKLLREDQKLGVSLFQYVAAVCATRVRQLEEEARRKAVTKAIIRDKIVSNVKRGADKVEFEEEGMVVIASASPLSKKKTGKKRASSRRGSKKKTTKVEKSNSNPLSLNLKPVQEQEEAATTSDMFNMLTAKKDQPGE